MSIWKGEEGGLPAVVYHERQGNNDSPTTKIFDDQLRTRIINGCLSRTKQFELGESKTRGGKSGLQFAKVNGQHGMLVPAVSE